MATRHLGVFTRPNGAPIDGAILARHFTALSGEAAPYPLHDFRHSAATLLLEEGVELVVIKELLGHVHIGVTAAVYAHVRLRLQRQAIDTFGNSSGTMRTVPPSPETRRILRFVRR